MNIALLGFGTVGTGVYKIVKNDARVTNRIRITHIFIRPGKPLKLPAMTSNLSKIFDDPKLDTVIEVMGGIEPAHTYIIKALKHHKNVVSANKAVIARYIDEFYRVANENHVKFYCEASVGGVIPWICNLKRALRIDKVNRIQGIFNGTSNYILYQMKETGNSFQQILRQAQKLGYAEADPSDDIDGYDIENKLCISADITYNTFIKPSKKLPCFGIRNINNKDIATFNRWGLTVKLVGKLHLQQNSYNYAIEPTLYHNNDLISHINGNYNITTMDGLSSGPISFIGQGAGQLPTAHAIIQDLLNIPQSRNDMEYNFNSDLKFNPNADKKDYIIRTNPELTCNLNYPIKKINQHYQLIKNISTGKMHQFMDSVLKQAPKSFMACVNK